VKNRSKHQDTSKFHDS